MDTGRRCPIKGAAVHNDAAQSSAVSANELGSGVDDDIRAMFDWPDQIGCPEGVVNHQGQTMGMGNLCDGGDIWNVTVGVAQCFDVDGFGIGLNSPQLPHSNHEC